MFECGRLSDRNHESEKKSVWLLEFWNLEDTGARERIQPDSTRDPEWRLRGDDALERERHSSSPSAAVRQRHSRQNELLPQASRWQQCGVPP